MLNYNSDQVATIFQSNLDDEKIESFSYFNKTEYYSEERLIRHEEFFNLIIDRLGLIKVPNAQIVAVMHMFPDVYPFLGAMKKIADISAIIPKPNSKIKGIVEDLEERGYPIMHIRRGSIVSITDSILSTKPTVFEDIGGYYANIIPELKKILKKNFYGIVEDTENGYKKYLDVAPDFPFYSAARSFLKEYEDRRVGRSIAEATEFVLTSIGVNIQELKNGTIGYGKIGRAYSKRIKGKVEQVVVSEIREDRLKMAEKAGFITTNTETILTESDLICVANGDRSITGNQFTKIKKGAYVVSVTSHDDAFDKSWLDNQEESGYKKIQHPKSEYVTLYNNPCTDHYFYLIADGNPINLVFQMPVGDQILLVHAELLVAVYRLLTNRVRIGEHEIDSKTRKDIFDAWIEIFGKEALEEDYEDKNTEENEQIDDIRTFAFSNKSESNNIIF